MSLTVSGSHRYLSWWAMRSSSNVHRQQLLLSSPGHTSAQKPLSKLLHIQAAILLLWSLRIYPLSRQLKSLKTPVGTRPIKEEPLTMASSPGRSPEAKTLLGSQPKYSLTQHALKTSQAEHSYLVTLYRLTFWKALPKNRQTQRMSWAWEKPNKTR